MASEARSRRGSCSRGQRKNWVGRMPSSSLSLLSSMVVVINREILRKEAMTQAMFYTNGAADCRER